MSRTIRIAGGSTLLVAGAAMLVLPGPGILAIAAGLAVLAKDVDWARRAYLRLKASLPKKARDQAEKIIDQDGG